MSTEKVYSSSEESFVNWQRECTAMQQWWDFDWVYQKQLIRIITWCFKKYLWLQRNCMTFAKYVDVLVQRWRWRTSVQEYFLRPSNGLEPQEMPVISSHLAVFICNIYKKNESVAEYSNDCSRSSNRKWWEHGIIVIICQQLQPRNGKYSVCRGHIIVVM